MSNTQKISQHLVDQWIANLCRGDIDAIVRMYYSHAILVPTFGQNICQGETAIRQYFIDFVENHPNLCGEVTLEISQGIRDVGIAISGNYTFTWGTPADEELGFQKEHLDARFTYVFTWDDFARKWKILTHHSSALPGKKL